MAGIVTWKGRTPKIGRDVFVADGAHIIGDVEIGAESSVWFNTVIRGDVNIIRIGERTSIQDCAVCHSTRELYPLRIGSDVTVGHSAVLHGCTVGDWCLVGMGAIILDDATVGDWSIVAAGSVVAPGTKIPPRTLAMGTPARPRRELTEEDVREIEDGVSHYLELARSYMAR